MSQQIVWRNPHATAGFVLLNSAVAERLLTYRQVETGSKEAGGILLGFRRGPHLEITDLTTPLRRDVRKRVFFDRRDPGHERYALKQWKDSNKMIDYVGEWHSHPEAVSEPSAFDMKEWRALLRSHRPILLFLVVGIVRIWAGVGASSGIRACTICDDSVACADISGSQRIEIP